MTDFRKYNGMVQNRVNINISIIKNNIMQWKGTKSNKHKYIDNRKSKIENNILKFIT